MKSIKEANFENKCVILRVDYSVVIEGGKIKDAEKIKRTIPTIEYIVNGGGKVVIISHLGRPNGKKVKALSLAPVAKTLSKMLEKKVAFVDDTVGAKAKRKVSKMKKGDIVLLENLRYSPYEELGDKEFAKKLALFGDIFVQDAFANAHRPHASMVAITEYLPSYAGLHFEKEYKTLSKLLKEPKKPFVFVTGGKKVETKIELLKKITETADIIVLGGGIANTFMVAEGYDIGNSFYEEEYVTDAENVIREAFDHGAEILFPDDVLVANRVSDSAKVEEKDIEQVSKNDIIVDIGAKTVAKYAQPLKFAGTILWNGPMGITEYKKFAKGNESIAKIILQSGAVTIVGGGDTIISLSDDELLKSFTYVSTGGGALMKFLAGEELPAASALK